MIIVFYTTCEGGSFFPFDIDEDVETVKRWCEDEKYRSRTDFDKPMGRRTIFLLPHIKPYLIFHSMLFPDNILWDSSLRKLDLRYLLSGKYEQLTKIQKRLNKPE